MANLHRPAAAHDQAEDQAVTPDCKTREVSARPETIEQRLDRKAQEADGRSFTAKSLGQMTYEERDKLLGVIGKSKE